MAMAGAFAYTEVVATDGGPSGGGGLPMMGSFSPNGELILGARLPSSLVGGTSLCAPSEANHNSVWAIRQNPNVFGDERNSMDDLSESSSPRETFELLWRNGLPVVIDLVARVDGRDNSPFFETSESVVVERWTVSIESEGAFLDAPDDCEGGRSRFGSFRMGSPEGIALRHHGSFSCELASSPDAMGGGRSSGHINHRPGCDASRVMEAIQEYVSLTSVEFGVAIAGAECVKHRIYGHEPGAPVLSPFVCHSFGTVNTPYGALAIAVQRHQHDRGFLEQLPATKSPLLTPPSGKAFSPKADDSKSKFVFDENAFEFDDNCNDGGLCTTDGPMSADDMAWQRENSPLCFRRTADSIPPQHELNAANATNATTTPADALVRRRPSSSTSSLSTLSSTLSRSIPKPDLNDGVSSHASVNMCSDSAPERPAAGEDVSMTNTVRDSIFAPATRRVTMAALCAANVGSIPSVQHPSPPRPKPSVALGTVPTVLGLRHGAAVGSPPAVRRSLFSSSSIAVADGGVLGNRRTSLTRRKLDFTQGVWAPSTPLRALVGSFEESILSGRMSLSPAVSLDGFVAQIGACGMGKCPAHVSVPFSATFFRLEGEDTPSPYVGMIDLDRATPSTSALPGARSSLPADVVPIATAAGQPQNNRSGNNGSNSSIIINSSSNPLLNDESVDASGVAHNPHRGLFRVPSKGMVQTIIFNQQRTVIKVFLVPYDLTDMPAASKTFIRQRTVTDTTPSRLKYAIHLKFVSTKRGHVYLYGSSKVVFSHRAPDSSKGITVVSDGPRNPQYAPLTSAERTAMKSKRKGHGVVAE